MKLRLTPFVVALSLLFVAWIDGQGTTEEEQCSNKESLENASLEDTSVESCSMYYYYGWMIAGRDYSRHAAVGWKDVHVPWVQHDRRAWPMFLRFHHVWENDVKKDRPFHFVLDPVRQSFSCHRRFYNLVPNNSNENNETAWKARVQIKAGDPLIIRCRNTEHTEANEGGLGQIDLETVQQNGVCVDDLQVRPSLRHGLGVFSTRSFDKDQVILPFVPLLHLHLSELKRPDDSTYEDLLRYCYGHNHTNVLLLPQYPVVHALNHDGVQPNVAIRRHRSVARKINWKLPAHLAFGESEEPILRAEYIALRDIRAGDELVLDYGFDINESVSLKTM